MKGECVEDYARLAS